MIGILEIIVSIILIVFILLQQRGGGLSSSIGGSGGSFYSTRRGVEKKLFWLTIALSIIFIGLAIISLFYKF